ncbi:MAG: HAD family hydrolase [Xanthomonadales bacterium]|nr:HAD family hydrolase [Xanthomonadales bacterium]
MSLLKLPHAKPKTILFDWHATLVDTKDAMYHAIDNVCYSQHMTGATTLEPGIPELLGTLRKQHIKLGVISNRKREFMQYEVGNVGAEDWSLLFDTMACGDDVAHRKPSPDLLLKALDNFGIRPDTSCWYVGDSTTDVGAAKEAKITAIFYNGASWDENWIDRIFPGTMRHPHQPDAVINSFSELAALVDQFVLEFA